MTDSNSVTTAPSTRTYTIGIKPSVSITGATHFKVHTNHTWTAQVKEVNTGGAITAYKWELNGSKVATSADNRRIALEAGHVPPVRHRDRQLRFQDHDHGEAHRHPRLTVRRSRNRLR